MALKQWVRLPTAWIEDRGLSAFRCAAGERSDNTAALMLLAVIAHHADDESGIARITYDRLGTATGLSRATISGGLSVLQRHSLIARGIEGRSTYQLCKYDPSRGWGKLPARHLYTSGEIVAFRDFHLRHRAELDALKLYYLFVARRNNATNLVQISYDKIDDYIGLGRHNIKRAISLLVTVGLIHVEHAPSEVNEHGVANCYRIVGVDSHNHMGTTGRGLISTGNFLTEPDESLP